MGYLQDIVADAFGDASRWEESRAASVQPLAADVAVPEPAAWMASPAVPGERAAGVAERRPADPGGFPQAVEPAAARPQEPAAIDASAQGRVWIAQDALEHGLVDHIGTLKDAVQAAARRAKLADGQYDVSYREKHLSWREALVRSVKTSTVRMLARAGLYRSAHPAIAHALSTLEQGLQSVASFNDPRGLYVYCSCDQR